MIGYEYYAMKSFLLVDSIDILTLILILGVLGKMFSRQTRLILVVGINKKLICTLPLNTISISIQYFIVMENLTVFLLFTGNFIKYIFPDW